MGTKLSKVRKLDGILSWSMTALSTCPGAWTNDGDVVDVCQFCYARQGNYHLPNVINAREHNRHDWKRDGWVTEMIGKLIDSRHFRWFDSGDIHHPALARKMLAIVRGTPWCKHWIPTRSYKLDRIKPILDEIAAEPNAVVRYSGDRTDGTYDTETLAPHGAIVVPSPAEAPEGVHVCPAYQHKPAKCNGCRACWDKDVSVVAYPIHGHRVKSPRQAA